MDNQFNEMFDKWKALLAPMETGIPRIFKPEEINLDTLDIKSPFEDIHRKIIVLNAMILAAVSLLDQSQRDAFPKAYADKLSELQLSIASSNQGD